MAASDFELDEEWETFKMNPMMCVVETAQMGNALRAQKRENNNNNHNHDVATIEMGGDNEARGENEKEIGNDAGSNSQSHQHKPPACSPIYISTTTKIAYLTGPIDIKNVFWEIPIIKYTDEREGVIKKQIKFSSTDRDEYLTIMARIEKERYADNQEIEHIDNPDGRIKFKDQRKISIGMSKKDILCYRSKRKRAFFNCFVIILRIRDTAADKFTEMHVKVFNTGKLEIPGIQTDGMLSVVLEMVVTILRRFVGDHLSCIPGKCDTVLINSNFNCGFYINRDKLHDLLKYKYRINSNYDSCSYPGIQSKFYYIIPNSDDQSQPQLQPTSAIIQSGQQPASGVKYYEISFMIFRTGSVLIVGKCTELILYVIYAFIKNILSSEYATIVNDAGAENAGIIVNRKKIVNAKVQRRTIIITSDEMK
jgi:hypothetical protein